MYENLVAIRIREFRLPAQTVLPSMERAYANVLSHISPWHSKGLASVEAKRKYKAPQVNCKQLLTMEGSLPGNEKFVHSDNAAGSLLKSSEDLISDTDDCDVVHPTPPSLSASLKIQPMMPRWLCSKWYFFHQVIAKFQDKRDAIVNLSDKGRHKYPLVEDMLLLFKASSEIHITCTAHLSFSLCGWFCLIYAFWRVQPRRI